MPRSEAKRKFQRKTIAKRSFDPRDVKVGLSLSLPVYQVAWLNGQAGKYHMGVSTYAASVFQSFIDGEKEVMAEQDRMTESEAEEEAQIDEEE